MQRVVTSTGKDFNMTLLQHDKLEHIFYCISKDELKNSYYFLVSNDYFIINLYTNKIVFDTDMPIKDRDKRMIELLGYWLNDSNLNLDNIYMFIRLKATTKPDFLHWWTRYNFTIEIERTLNYDYFRN